MALITTVIGKQAFELIRDRIASILVLELSNQVVLGTDVVNASIWTERLIPFSNSELPALNVNMSSGGFSGQTIIQSNGTYLFNIDCYVKAPSTGDDDGDVTAMLLLQRLIGVCRAILEASQYKTLDFPPPFISSRHAQAINISTPKTEDSESVAMGRLTFEVKAVETAEVLDAILLVANYTQVKISLTNKGYQYKFFGPNPSITIYTPVIDLNALTISIPFSYHHLDPLGKYVILVSDDNGATFVENTSIGQCNLLDAANFSIGSGGIPVGTLLVKFRSVDFPSVESAPIVAITEDVASIQSYTAGISNITFATDSNDGWDVALLAAPTSSQKPSGVTLVDCEYKIDFWNTGTKTAIDSGTITANDTFNTGANGEGVYEVVCKYNFSDGSHFRIRGLYRVDAADTIIASILMGGINVNSVSGLDMNVSAIITQVGCLYTPYWVAFDIFDNGTEVGTGITADLALPIGTIFIGCLIDLDSIFSDDYDGDNAIDFIVSIS